MNFPIIPETLESRRLFAATLLASRSLEITGTNAADSISVDREPRTPFLTVTINGEQSVFRVNQVQQIFIYGFDGDDVIRVGLGHFGNFGGSVVINTHVEGGEGNDRITTDMGNDTLLGGPGNDFLAGYRGRDVLDGGDGDDELVIQIGSNTALGGSGNDLITAEVGARGSNIDGGDGDDNITGSSGRDIIHGGAGNDIINGAGGPDQIFGDDGDDIIAVPSAKGRILGNAGADTFAFTFARTPRIQARVLKDLILGQDNIADQFPPTT